MNIVTDGIDWSLPHDWTLEDLQREIVDPTEYSHRDSYLGNQKIKSSGVLTHWTPEMEREYWLCANDIEYFARKYVKIITLDRGIENIVPYPYQIKMWDNFEKHRFIITLACRQSGKSTSYVVYVLHCLLFKRDYFMAIAANKAASAVGILARVRLAFENLPFWLQPGCKTWNKGSLEFENNSSVAAYSADSNSLRSRSMNLLLLDEFSFVLNDLAFMTSTYPVISAGTTTKIIMVSTANGVGNQFYKIWQEATQGVNSYFPIRVDWWEVPGRDEKWKEETIRNTSQKQFQAEFGNDFLGTGNTLISANKLLALASKKPEEIYENETLRLYERPKVGHQYALTCDVAKGRGIDATTFTIFDCTEDVIKPVAVYQDDMVSPLLMGTLLFKWAKIYNDAFCIIESNDQGYLVASSLWYDFEYENVFVESTLKNTGIGVNVNKKIKAIGCTMLKDIVEQDRILIQDKQTIEELNNFVVDGASYNAVEGKHDDLVANLWLFAWFLTTSVYQHWKDNPSHLRDMLFAEQVMDIEESVPYFGIMNDGIDLIEA